MKHIGRCIIFTSMLKGGSIGTLNLLFIEHCSTGKGFIWSFSPLHCFTLKLLHVKMFNPKLLQPCLHFWALNWDEELAKLGSCWSEILHLQLPPISPDSFALCQFFLLLKLLLIFLPISPDIFFLCQICFFLNYCLFFSWFLTITFFFTKFVVFLNYCLLLPITFFRLLKLLLIFSRFLPMAFSLTNLSSS